MTPGRPGAPILHAGLPPARAGCKWPGPAAIAAVRRLHSRSLEECVMQKTIKKLRLNKQQVRVLAAEDLAQAAGGWIRPPITWSCPQLSAACGAPTA